MHTCPKCQSTDIYRSRVKTSWEVCRRDFTGKRLYRCHACGWRGWGVDTGPRFGDADIETAAAAIAPDPPDLEATDVARSDAGLHDVDFDAIDSLIARSVKRK